MSKNSITSGIFSLIAFHTGAEKLDNWVLPITWSIFIIAFFLTIGYYIMNKDQKKFITNSLEEILEEVQYIEDNCDKPAENEQIVKNQ